MISPNSNKGAESVHANRKPIDSPKAPAELSKEDWLSIAKRLYNKVEEFNVTMLSAAVAFYAMLAIFPALAAVVTLYALVADPSDVADHLDSVSSVIPSDVITIFNDQLNSIIIGQQEHTLGFRLFLGLGLAIWSAHRGVHALVNAITIAYQEQESRNFIHLNAFTLLLTIGVVLIVLFAMIVMLAIPIGLDLLPFSSWQSTLTTISSWLAFFVVVIFSFSLLYRFSPPRRPAKWRWLSTGAIVATILWLTSSMAFSIYVSRFGNYNETYGTLGAIVVLLLWFFLTSFSIVLGALINAEMELQTHSDTTVGADRPMGLRGAAVADTPPPGE